MPKIKSAKKALRQSARKKLMNQRRKVKFKAAVKEFRKSISLQQFDKAKALLPSVYKSLDKAAKSNTIKANKASRLKSRLAKTLKPQTPQA